MGKDKQRVLRNRANKAARRAVRKAKRRKAALAAGAGFSARFGVSRTEIGASPIHRALVSQAIFEQGIGDVLVSRTLQDGRIALACALVDPYCLGIKDAFLRVLSMDGYDELVAHAAEVQRFEEVTPAYARKLIDDAIDYADSLGFEPHEDFNDLWAVLDPIDATSCDARFTFGKNGKPFYVNGPNHGIGKARAIILHLIERCGPDGFHYLVGDLPPDVFDDLPVAKRIVAVPNADASLERNR
jgi:hypothetical protein